MDRCAAILQVEDDPVDVVNLRRAFSRCGLANPLRAAGSGEEALGILRGRRGEPGHRPDVVLLDLSMPGMGGLELLRRLKADPELRRIPVVVLTASAHDADRASAWELGAAGYVVKPIDFEDFVRTVELVVRYWQLCALA